MTQLALKVYIDTCIAIYLIEGDADLAKQISKQINTPDDHRFFSTQICTSPLTKMECMIGVLKQQNKTLEIAYKHFFSATYKLAMLDSTFELATRLRVQHNLKTPDALHLAAAIENQCDEFWTNDHRLNKAASSHLSIKSFSKQQNT